MEVMKIFMIFKEFLLHTVGDSQLFRNVWQLNDMDDAVFQKDSPGVL